MHLRSLCTISKAVRIMTTTVLLAGFILAYIPVRPAAAHAPTVFVHTWAVNEITDALTEGTDTPTDDVGNEFVHLIQNWGGFGAQNHASAQAAADWVVASILQVDDLTHYGAEEAWANPEQTLADAAGDIEDLAFLLASLLKWHNGEVDMTDDDRVVVDCGDVIMPFHEFYCWVSWWDDSANTLHRIDPATGAIDTFLGQEPGTLLLTDQFVTGYLEGYYPGPLPEVAGYVGGNFTRIAKFGFGDRMNSYPWSQASFQDDLYVGTIRNMGYQFDTMIASMPISFSWVELFFDATHPHMPEGSLAWAEDQRAEIWRLHDDAPEQVYQSPIIELDGFGYMPREMGLREMMVFTDTLGTEALYATTGTLHPEMCAGSLMLSSTNGLTWEKVVTNPAMGCDSRAMAVHNGKLYVATALVGEGKAAQIWVSDSPSTLLDNWTLVADFSSVDTNNTNVTSLASFNGHLYAGTENFATGFQVFRSDAHAPVDPALGAWSQILSNGAGDMLNSWTGAMLEFSNQLYVTSMSWPLDLTDWEIPPDALDQYPWLDDGPEDLAFPKGFELLRIDPDDSWELVIADYYARRPPGGQVMRWPSSNWPGGFGNFLNLYGWSLVEEDGVLYLGTFDASSLFHLLRFTDWSANLSPSDTAIEATRWSLGRLIGMMEAYQINETYIRPFRQIAKELDTGNPDLIDWDAVFEIAYGGFGGADIWKTEDGDYWQPVTMNGFGNPLNYGARNLTVVNPMYAGMANPYTGLEVWRALSTTSSRVGGYIYHDDNGDGQRGMICRRTDLTPAGCEPGVELATAETTHPSGYIEQYVTGTSGWYSFNLLEAATYSVISSPRPGAWWTPTTPEACEATVGGGSSLGLCHFGYWWGLDWPPPAKTTQAAEQTVLRPTKDASISEWNASPLGGEPYVTVRQPGVISTLVQFDLVGIPYGAQIKSAEMKLYSPSASNLTNRLYVTVYPLTRPWAEGEASWQLADAGSPWTVAGAVADHAAPVGWSWMDRAGWISFDLDPNEVLANDYGYIIVGEGTSNREVGYEFFSREYANLGVQPMLTLAYELP